MEAVGDRFIYYPQPQNRSVFLEISITSNEIKYMFPDSSYVSMDARTAIIRRFNASSGHTEQFIADSPGVPDWQTSTANLNLYQNYINFENSPNETDTCQIGEVSSLCPFSQRTTFTDYSNEYGVLSNCASQQSYLLNHGYNGFPTLNRCTRSARMGVIAVGFVTVGACVIEPTKVPCAGAWVTWLATMHNENDVRHQCVVSYNQAVNNLQQCQNNQTGGGSGGSGGSGGGSGSEGGGGLCVVTDNHQVCTPGGCNYWVETRIINC